MTVRNSSSGPGLSRASFGCFGQAAPKFGAIDSDDVTIAPGSTAHVAACSASPEPAGCSDQQKWRFGYWRDDLFQGMQKLWIDPSISGQGAGSPVQRVRAQLQTCQVRSGAGLYTFPTYDQVIRGALGEGRIVLLGLASGTGNDCGGNRPVRFDDLNNAYADAQTLTEGLYKWIEQDLPAGSLNRVYWTWVNEPDLAIGTNATDTYEAGLTGMLDKLNTLSGSNNNFVALAPEISRFRQITTGLDDRESKGKEWIAKVVGLPGVDYISYHALWVSNSGVTSTANCTDPWGSPCAETEFYHYYLPESYASVSTGKPLVCTEWRDDGVMNSTPPGTLSLAGFLSLTRALLYQTQRSKLEGSLLLSVMEGDNSANNPETGIGLVENTTQDLDGDGATELFIQGPTPTYWPFRMILRDLGANDTGTGTMLKTTTDTRNVVASTRKFGNDFVVVVMNQGGAKNVTIKLPAGPATTDFSIRQATFDAPPRSLPTGATSMALDVRVVSNANNAVSNTLTLTYGGPLFCIDDQLGTKGCALPAFAATGQQLLFQVLNPLGGATYDWDFESDGTFDATGASVTFAYPTAGSYDVTLRGTTLGCSSMRTETAAAHIFDQGTAPVPNVVTGPGRGPTNPSRVWGFFYDFATPTPPVPTWLDIFAYGVPGFGANVGAGDIGEGTASILTGPGPGSSFGPQVKAFSARQGGLPIRKVNFYAYGTLRFGVNVSAGDIDGDPYFEILTGPGPGEVFGPHVRGFDYDGGNKVAAIPDVNFFAYKTLKWGVNVDAGSFDLDIESKVKEYDEILTGLRSRPHLRIPGARVQLRRRQHLLHPQD